MENKWAKNQLAVLRQSYIPIYRSLKDCAILTWETCVTCKFNTVLVTVRMQSHKMQAINLHTLQRVTPFQQT